MEWKTDEHGIKSWTQEGWTLTIYPGESAISFSTQDGCWELYCDGGKIRVKGERLVEHGKVSSSVGLPYAALRAILVLVDPDSTQSLIRRLMKRADDAAVSGAALAARVYTQDPDTQKVVMDSVKAVRNPSAVLSRLMDVLDEPMECGHPVECIPDHKPEEAHLVGCGWCKAIREKEEADAAIEAALKEVGHLSLAAWILETKGLRGK